MILVPAVGGREMDDLDDLDDAVEQSSNELDGDEDEDDGMVVDENAFIQKVGDSGAEEEEIDAFPEFGMLTSHLICREIRVQTNEFGR